MPLAPLAEAARVVLVQRRIVGLDLERKVVRTDRDELIEFDLLSIASGPAVDFDRIPGSRDFALPIRPLDNFVEGWARIHAHALTTEAPLRLTVIGAGAGGVEIALAMKYRLAVCRDRVRVQLVTGTGSILPGHGMRARALVKDALLRQGVRLVEGAVRHLERGLGATRGRRRAPVRCDHPGHRCGSRSVAGRERAGHRRARIHPRHAEPAVGVASVRVRGRRRRDLCRRPPRQVPRVRRARGTAARPEPDRHARRPAAGAVPAAAPRAVPDRHRPRHAVASWGQLAVSGNAVWQWKDRIDRAYVAKFRFG